MKSTLAPTHLKLWLLLVFRHSAKNYNAQDVGFFTLVGDKDPPAARDSRGCIFVKATLLSPHWEWCHCWCLSGSLSLSVGFSIQDEAMDVARSTPQEAHYHTDVIYLLP